MNYCKPIIFVCGNDGVGKTTAVENIRNIYPNYLAYERSSPDITPILKKEIDLIDKMTLKYSYENYADLCNEICIDNILHKIYWIILDLPVETIEKRIENRLEKTIWESHKALVYFRNRFREMSAYYGFPLINVENMDCVQVCNEIVDVIQSNLYEEINHINTKNMTIDSINNIDIEYLLNNNMIIPNSIIEEFSKCEFDTENTITEHIVKNMDKSEIFKRKILARWIVNNYDIKYDGSNISLSNENATVCIEVKSKPKLVAKLIAEGESKRVYKIITNNKYVKDMAIILLKSTIYSHSKQATGHIENLGSIRGTGSKIFLEMFWRNDIKHSYRSIGKNGIIISDFVETNPIEIVFKKYCEGTDKYSYHNLTNLNSSVLKTGEYKNGPYIRFDWRNPNHIMVNDRSNVLDNIYYYLLEEHYGKEQFFETLLSENSNIKPFGDKCVSEDLLHDLIDIDNCRKTAMKVYCTVDAYLSRVGLEVKDGCMMLESGGNICWSEVNQDCMRLKTTFSGESLDKDLWRSGGSSSKQLITKKWELFNDLMMSYFKDFTIMDELKKYNRFAYQDTASKILSDQRLNIGHKYRHIYEEFCRGNSNKSRRVILTMDLYDRQPVLVKSGKVFENHTGGNYMDAFEKMSIHPDVLVVDLNGAINGDNTVNRDIIKKLATDHYIHSGGGIRSLEDAQDILGSSARRIVVSSNTDKEFINKIPKERLIVELSLDQEDNVLINGRKTNTGIKYSDKIKELVSLGVEAISLTFHHTEGHLNGIPRKQISDIIEITPDKIKKIIIAGGISDIGDMEYLWSFEKVIPQLGSAIWKNKITIGEIYAKMAKYDKYGLIPAIIQDKYGMVKGLVYMNGAAIIKTIDTRILYRYSREHKKLMCKGETSGNHHKVTKVSLDCDSDAILVTVDTENPLCHTGNFSCFSNQSIIKSNINTLNQHIKSKKGEKSYSGNMQMYSGLVLAKIMEEFWEIVCATDKHQVDECSDFLVHFIMYLNSKDISLDDILNELNARRWDPRILSKKNQGGKHKLNPTQIVIGITSEKYSKKTDDFAKHHLGFEIQRPSGKSLKIDHKIVDNQKYEQYFNGKTISLVPLRPKDMSWMLASGTIDCAITYNSVMQNQPMVYKEIASIPDTDLSLVLIKRKNDTIDPSTWSSEKKMVIATESINFVNEYLASNNISGDCYTLAHISGTSESFLVNDTKTNYLLCDAIMESGRTIEENGLEVWKTVKNKGDIKICLYGLIEK